MNIKKLFSNTIAMLAARILYRFFNALVAIIIARYLGVEKFGIYSTALALVNTLLIANDIGSTTLLLREGSRDKNKIDIYFGNSLLIQLLASAGFFIITLLIGFLLNYDQVTMLLVVVLGVSTIIFEFRKSFRSVLRILIKLKFIALIEAITGFLIFTSTYIISKTILDKDIGLIIIAFIPLFCNLIFISTVFIYDLKFIKPKFKISLVWPMIKDGYIYTIYNIFYIAYFQISILMLQYLKGNEAAGLYSAASKLVILVLIVPQMIFQVALPLMFKYFKHDISKYKKLHLMLFRYLNAFGVPVAIGMFILAEQIINFVYNKPGFLQASQALQIFAIFLLFRFIGNVSGQSLTTIDKQKQENIIQIFSFIFLCIINYFLILKLGIIGAVIGTLITEAIIRISFIICDFYYLKINIYSYLIKLPILFISAILMGILVYFTKDNIHVILSVLFGAFLYGLFLWILRFFKPQDISLFKQLLPKKIKSNS